MQDVSAIVVTGGRDFVEYHFVHDILYCIKPKFIVLGDCLTGVDALAFNWAMQTNTTYKILTADWDKYGKPAGPMRNREMIQAGLKVGAILVVFPGNQGTANCKLEAEKAKMPVIVVRPGR